MTEYNLVNLAELIGLCGYFALASKVLAFCAAWRTLMRFRADALRSKTDTLKRSLCIN